MHTKFKKKLTFTSHFGQYITRTGFIFKSNWQGPSESIPIWSCNYVVCDEWGGKLEVNDYFEWIEVIKEAVNLPLIFTLICQIIAI